MRATDVARTADANLQNSINISIIFNYLRERGPSYRAQIARALNISLPAVSRAVENLIDHGYVVADGIKLVRVGPVEATAERSGTMVENSDEVANDEL